MVRLLAAIRPTNNFDGSPLSPEQQRRVDSLAFRFVQASVEKEHPGVRVHACRVPDWAGDD